MESRDVNIRKGHIPVEAKVLLLLLLQETNPGAPMAMFGEDERNTGQGWEMQKKLKWSTFHWKSFIIEKENNVCKITKLSHKFPLRDHFGRRIHRYENPTANRHSPILQAITYLPLPALIFSNLVSV